MENNFVKRCLANGGSIAPMFIPPEETSGLGIMNPSVLVDGGKILVNLRQVNYTFYHSEKKLYQHPWGPLVYIHPEDDMHLRIWNYYAELNSDLQIEKLCKIDTSELDQEPLWEFVGLEDGRLVRWNGDLYLTGVRRDTTTDGQGRMELSKLEVGEDYVKEVSRVRIEAPNDPNSYCEKNWMPILDRDFQYIKWSNPTEVVQAFPETSSSVTLHTADSIPLPRDLRGGSQVVPFGEYYIALTHEVCLYNDTLGRKDGNYMHRFVVWDKDFNIYSYSQEFLFMDGQVEFAVGMAEYGDFFLITFGFTDNASFILKAPKHVIETFINESIQNA